MQLAGRGGLVAAEQDAGRRGIEEASQGGLGPAPRQVVEGQPGAEGPEAVDLGPDDGDQVASGGLLALLDPRRVGAKRRARRVEELEVAPQGRGQGVDPRVARLVRPPTQQVLGPGHLVEHQVAAEGHVLGQLAPGAEHPVDPLGGPLQASDGRDGVFREPLDGVVDVPADVAVVVGLGGADGLGEGGGLVGGAAVEADREEGRAVGQDALALADGLEVVAQGHEPSFDLGGVLDGQGQPLARQAMLDGVAPDPGLPFGGRGTSGLLCITTVGGELCGGAGHGCGSSGGSMTGPGRSSGVGRTASMAPSLNIVIGAEVKPGISRQRERPSLRCPSPLRACPHVRTCAGATSRAAPDRIARRNSRRFPLANGGHQRNH